jgi:hypothetical protein
MRRRRWPSATIKISSSARPVALVVVVTIVHPQGPPVELEFVQVSDRCCRRIHICVLQEAEAFGSAGLLVVYEAEVDHLASTAKDLTDLLLTHAWWIVSCCRIAALKRICFFYLPYGMLPMKTTLPPFSLLCAIFVLWVACACWVLLYSVACAR